MRKQLDTALGRLGVSDPRAIAIGTDWKVGTGETLAVHSPIDGTLLARVPAAKNSDAAAAIDSAAEAFLRWRLMPAPQRGELVRRIGEQLAAAQGRSGRAGDAGVRQNPGRVSRRSAGDDRHLRLCRRLEPAVVWPDDCQRTTGTSAGRTVASLGAGGRDHGVQLSRGRVGLERHAGAGLWRHAGLETIGEDAAVRHGLPAIGGRRAGRRGGRSGRCAESCGRRRRGGSGHCFVKPVAVGLGYRFGRHGTRRGAVRRRAIGTFAAGTGRKQRRRSSLRRPTCHWRCERSFSRPRARAASAARRCDGSSYTVRSPTTCWHVF